MNKPTTLCLLESENDISWIEGYHRQHQQAEHIVVAVYSLFGRIAAEKIKVDCTFFDELAWSVDNYGLAADVGYAALAWPEAISGQGLKRLFHFRDYPLALMHQPNLKRSVMYILPSLVLARRIFEICHPDKVLMGWKDGPFSDREMVHAGLGPDGAFEWECARELCRQRDIALWTFSGGELRQEEFTTPPPPGRVSESDCAFVAALEERDCLGGVTYEPAPGYSAHDCLPGKGKRRRMLFFSWGSYYLHDLLPCFDILLEQGCQIVVAIIGGDVAPEDLRAYTERGVFFYRKEGFRLRGEAEIRKRLEGIYGQAGEALEASRELETFFSNEGGGFYRGLAGKALRKEIGNMPNTILELLRTELLLGSFEPDAVFAHFSVGATPGWGCYDVLPARRLGIPTLSLDHGVVGNLTVSLAISACEYYATYGERQRQGLIDQCGFDPAKVRAVGKPRLEKPPGATDKRAAKLALGLDPERPVVVYCSISELGGLYVSLHSTYATLQAILRLKQELPGIQLLYRAHHGLDYGLFKKYFGELAIPGLTFESSLEPPHPFLADLLLGTDLLVSQAGSAMTEAAIQGVPAIYFCARSYLEPVFLLDGAFPLALTAEALSGLVRESLERPLPLSQQRQAHIDNVLCGNDGQSALRLAEFLLDIVDKPGVKGWDDWAGRLRAACRDSIAIAVDTNGFQQARLLAADDQAAYTLGLFWREDLARRAAGAALEALASRPGPKTVLHMGSHGPVWLALAVERGLAARSLETGEGGVRAAAALFKATGSQHADILVCSEVIDQIPSKGIRGFVAELANAAPVVILVSPPPGLPSKSVLAREGWEIVRQSFTRLEYAPLDIGPACGTLHVYVREEV